jgi:hypothetical protein
MKTKTTRLTKPQKEALEICKENPDITPKELSAKMGNSVSGAGLILGRLRSKGLLGSDKSGVMPGLQVQSPPPEVEAGAPEGFSLDDLRSRIANAHSSGVLRSDDTDEKTHERVFYYAKALLDSCIVELKGDGPADPAEVAHETEIDQVGEDTLAAAGLEGVEGGNQHEAAYNAVGGSVEAPAPVEEPAATVDEVDEVDEVLAEIV